MKRHRGVRVRASITLVIMSLVVLAALALAACGGSGPTPAASPSVRGAAGTIAFVRALPLWEPVYGLCVVNADGTGFTVLDSGPGFKSHPSWSPDGSRIVYAVLPEGDELYRAATLWVVNADGSGKRRLTRDPLRGDMPTWSPDGALIVFSRYSRRTDSLDIAVMDTAGRHVRRLTRGVDDDFYPTWASARRILFLRNGALFSVDADGGGLVRLQGVGTTHGDYALSPDGARIAVPRDASDRLVVVGFPRGGRAATLLHPLSRFIIENSHVAPAWKPDGTKLVVGAGSFLHRGLGSLLYIIDADGSGRSVVPGVDKALDPAWRPQ